MSGDLQTSMIWNYRKAYLLYMTGNYNPCANWRFGVEMRLLAVPTLRLGDDQRRLRGKEDLENNCRNRTYMYDLGT